MDCITAIMDACYSRRDAILHIYRSVHLEDFLNRVDKLALYVIRSYIDTAAAALPLRPEDRKLLIRFYKCMFVGIALEWLRTGMREDLRPPPGSSPLFLRALPGSGPFSPSPTRPKRNQPLPPRHSPKTPKKNSRKGLLSDDTDSKPFRLLIPYS